MTNAVNIADATLKFIHALRAEGIAKRNDDLVIRLEGRAFDLTRQAFMSLPAETVMTATDLFNIPRDPKRFHVVGVVFEQGPYQFRRDD